MNFVPYNATIAKKEPVKYRLVPMDRELAIQVAEIEKQNFSHPWTERMRRPSASPLNPDSSALIHAAKHMKV